MSLVLVTVMDHLHQVVERCRREKTVLSEELFEREELVKVGIEGLIGGEVE